MPDLSTPQSRLLFVTPYAQKFGLEPEIVCAVCEQESAWEPGAARFEPAFLRRYVEPLKFSLLEELDRSTSWGLMQIMGQTAVEFGFVGRCSDLRDPEQGVLWGCKKLQRCYFIHGAIDDTALLAYNGGGNPEYGKEVLARVSKYKFGEAG